MESTFKHIVVLMMENRSFDHMLGYLKSSDFPIEGLNGDETNVPADEGPPIRVSPNARSMNDLNPDPSHEFIDINWQIFRNSEGVDRGQEKMQGFVENYATDSGNKVRGENVMKCFHADSLPVLSSLARKYAICDHWFSSVPASTIPNRLFAHAASSGDSLTQDAVQAPFEAKTIFEIIDDPNNDADYRIYSSGATILMANRFLSGKQNKFFDFRTRFRQDCERDMLPEYTFIEPVYDDDPINGLLASSQHPDFSVTEGESLIAEVYNAVRLSPGWKDTLLLIVYDEHGGTFDHVTPPSVTRDPTRPEIPDIPPTKDFGFRFDRLGVRVPAVFVSPRIKAGTIIHTQFDHCSIVATVRKLFCLDKNPFNWREAQAATFDEIANLGDDEIRTDTVPLNSVVSNGTIQMKRSPVLSEVERQMADGAITQSGILPVVHTAATQDFRTALAPPVAAPGVRKPTDLVMLMAQAYEYSLEKLGVHISQKVSHIYSYLDAARFFAEAHDAIRQSGGGAQ